MSVPFLTARGKASAINRSPSRAIPSHIGWNSGEVYDSTQCVSASAPVAAVSFGGRPTVSSGSRMTSLAKRGWKITAAPVQDHHRTAADFAPGAGGRRDGYAHGARAAGTRAGRTCGMTRPATRPDPQHFPHVRALPPPRAMTASHSRLRNISAPSSTSPSAGLGETPAKTGHWPCDIASTVRNAGVSTSPRSVTRRGFEHPRAASAWAVAHRAGPEEDGGREGEGDRHPRDDTGAPEFKAARSVRPPQGAQVRGERAAEVVRRGRREVCGAHDESVPAANLRVRDEELEVQRGCCCCRRWGTGEPHAVGRAEHLGSRPCRGWSQSTTALRTASGSA